MPKSYGRREVYEMLRVYGSLIGAIERLGNGLSIHGPNQFARDKIARQIFYELIPEYKRWVPEEIRSTLPFDINNLEKRCEEAIIPKRFEASPKP